MKPLPARETIAALFRYDEATGNLIWRNQTQGSRAGEVAGSLQLGGYISVQCGPCKYKAHRLIWKLIHGTDPEFDVDHIDGDRSNNRGDNLRAATRTQNCQNAKRSRSGLKGAYRLKGKWISQIRVFGKTRYLGIFDTEIEAHQAYAAAVAANFGEFARAA